MFKNIVCAALMAVSLITGCVVPGSNLKDNLTEDAWYDRVEHYCLTSLAREDEEYPNESYYEHLMRCMRYQRNPSVEKRRRAAFKIINQEQKKVSSDSVLNDPMTWQDLCLFNGKTPTIKAGSSLLDIIDRTKTDLGKAMLACMLVQPSTAIDELNFRKALIRELIENPLLLEKFINALDRFKKAEALLLSFWMNDPLKQPLERHYYNFPPKVKRLNKLLNSSELALDVKSILEHAKRYIFFGCATLAAGVLPLSGLALIAGRHDQGLYKQIADIGLQSEFSELEKINAIQKIVYKAENPSLLERLGKELKGTGGPTLALISATVKNKNVSGTAAIVAGVYCALSAKEDYEWARDNVILDMCIQERMIAVADAVAALQEINSCMKSLKNYEKVFRFRSGITDFFTIKESTHSVKEQWLKLLATTTFKGNPSPFSRTGRVLRAYASMRKLKKEWGEALATVAEVDVYISMALLYKEFESQTNHYCFVDFVDAEKPMLSVQEFWNPFINCAIPNSLDLGGQEKSSIILTGPNAGGKSTVLRALGINVLLAQNFGIAAAQSMRMTPFTIFATYFNIVDDLANGKSLFKAEVLRAQELVEKVKGLNPGKYGFILADELFKGTGPQEAAAVAYSVAKHLGNSEGILTIIATHFPLLTTLEETSDHIMNYKVSVDVTLDGNICYPFKLERGVSQQHIALAILRSQGFSSDILNEAYERVIASV